MRYAVSRLPIRKFLVLVALAAFCMVALTAGDCDGKDDTSKDLRHQSTDIRWDRNEMAIDRWGYPATVNFPLFKVIYDMTLREDMMNHPWYLYVITELGTYTGYYIATTPPVNACVFLSSTEEVRSGEHGSVVLTVPSLDGVFYGGGGASGACDAWVFFDYTTGAMIWTREKMRASDAPFILPDVPHLVLAETVPDLGPAATPNLPSPDPRDRPDD